MAKAEYKSGRRKLAVDVLRGFMHDFEALALAAKQANDPAYTKYAKIAAEIATTVAGFESPRLTALAVAPAPAAGPTVFKLSIFDQTPRRKPPLLEATPVADDATAPATDAVGSDHSGTSGSEDAVASPDAQSMSTAHEDPKPAEPTISTLPSPPNDAPAPPGWARSKSLWEHPIFAQPRRFGTKHH